MDVRKRLTGGRYRVSAETRKRAQDVRAPISLGAVTVPDLKGDTATQAISELTAVGLATHIEHRAQCVDLGLVIDQTPSAGTSVAPGSTVTITIASGTLHSC